MSVPPAVPAKRAESPAPSSSAPLTSPAISHQAPRDTEYSVVRQGGTAPGQSSTVYGSAGSVTSEPRHPRTESPTPLIPDEDHSRLSTRDVPADSRIQYHQRDFEAGVPAPRNGSNVHDSGLPTSPGAGVRFNVGSGNSHGSAMGSVGRSRGSGVFLDDGGRYPQTSNLYSGQSQSPQLGHQNQPLPLPIPVTRRSYTLLNEAGAANGYAGHSLNEGGGGSGPGGMGWNDVIGSEPKDISTRRLTIRERVEPTLHLARAERDKYAARARMTGYSLNGAIGAQVVLGALTTGLSAALSGKQVSTVTAVLGGLSTMAASYLARTRGSNEPELSISRTKDLEQFIRECEAFQLDFGHLYGVDHRMTPAPPMDEHNKPDADTTVSDDGDLKRHSRMAEGTPMERFLDSKLEDLRGRFEALLGNASGERKLSEPLGTLGGRV